MFTKRVLILYSILLTLISVVLFLLYDSVHPLAQQTDIVQQWTQNFCRGKQGIDDQLRILYIPTFNITTANTSNDVTTAPKSPDEMTQATDELRTSYEQMLSQYESLTDCQSDIIYLSKREQVAGWFAYPDVVEITYVDVDLTWKDPEGKDYKETRTVQVYNLKSGEEKVWPDFALPSGQVIYPTNTSVKIVDSSTFVIGAFRVIDATAYKQGNVIFVGVQTLIQTMASRWVGSEVALYSGKTFNGATIRTSAVPVEHAEELLPTYRDHFAPPRADRLDGKISGLTNWYWFQFTDPSDFNHDLLYMTFRASIIDLNTAPSVSSYVALPDSAPLFTEQDSALKFASEHLTPVKSMEHIADRDDITYNEQHEVTAQSWYFTGVIDASAILDDAINVDCNNFVLHLALDSTTDVKDDATIWLRPVMCDVSGLYNRTGPTRRFIIRFTYEPGGSPAPLVPQYLNYQAMLDQVPYPVRVWSKR